MKLYYGKPNGIDYALLLHFVTDWHLGKKTADRSTLPLLNYWKNSEKRITQMLTRLNANDSADADLCFEYPTPSANSSSKPSFTDLAYLSSQTAIFIEAKWTEPLYKNVGRWQEGGGANKQRVLNHWLSLIKQRACVVGDIESVDYQMLHRMASACAAYSEKAYLVYQVFQIDLARDVHKAALQQLVQVCVPGSKLEVWWHSIKMRTTSLHKEMVDRFREEQDESKRAMAVRSALISGNLFEFSEEQFERIK